MIKKIIVTIKSNLNTKYGVLMPKIEALLKKLIDYDQGRGIDTSLIYIDDAAIQQKYGLQALTDFSPKSCKLRVDELYQMITPEYLVIFGAQDVFPFQDIKNQVYSQGNDDDKIVPSDLPYACDAPFSDDWNKFTSPTRVVGRIPDLPGDHQTDYIERIIENIIKSSPQTRAYYGSYFASSAKVWQKSTEESVKNIYGSYAELVLCPPIIAGKVTKVQLGAMSHFYNCHGSLNTTDYYGQEGGSYPPSISTALLDGKISYGNVTAAECCYGSQLLDPNIHGKSIASNYLFNGSLSFMGSSTIAYGPVAGQGLADLICQYYLINVLAGASCGRAMLEARQKFLTVSGPTLDPLELKTLAQFHILGDPSLQLVAAPVVKGIQDSIDNRRLNLFTKGINLGFSTASTVKQEEDDDAAENVQGILEQTGFSGTSKMTFVVEPGLSTDFFINEVSKFNLKAMPVIPESIKFQVYQQSDQEKEQTIKQIKTLVVKVANKKVLGYRVYLSR